jgi:hypothetical protein
MINHKGHEGLCLKSQAQREIAMAAMGSQKA